MQQKNMTWREFKSAIEKLMDENNISEDNPLWYLDIKYPKKNDVEKNRLCVYLNPLYGVAISHDYI